MKIKGILKVLGTASAGAGISYGGVEIWDLMTTRTWMDYMNKQGIKIFSDTDSDTWSAIWNLHAEEIKKYDPLKTKTKGDEIKEWCKNEVKNSYSKSDSEKLEKLKKFCSPAAFSSINDAVTLSAKEKLTLIEQDDDYKLVFAIYKFPDEKTNESQLLKWLNEGVENEKKLTSDSKTDDGYKKLKEKCEQQKDLSWNKKKQKFEHESYYWWCTKQNYNSDFFKNKKVSEKVFGKEKNKFSNVTKTEIVKKWNNTEEVTTVVKKYLTRQADLTKADWRKFCNEVKEKKLTEDDVYQKYYLIYKSVCVEKISLGVSLQQV